jgi:hypothetical protein
MAYNTRNFENGEKETVCETVNQWRKYITRHCQDWKKGAAIRSLRAHSECRKSDR